ncbi:MAG: transposase [Akkermansiaceae bacterium]|jgi:transposase|nr:transposase [Luteolibacter sp.]
MKTKIPSITIGLDLGDKKHALCVLNQDGEIVDERMMTNHRESLRRLSQKYPSSRIAMEVGSHSPWISRFFKQLGHDVFVANPRKLRAIYTSDRKSDKNDARMLAKIARIDPQLLYPIEHGAEQSQRDLLQIKLRDNLVRQRVDIISSVRFTLKSLGIALPSPNSACFAKRCRTLLAGVHEDLLVDWLPKVLTQKGDFLGFEFCRSRGSFATVPAMESRFLRCSSVADIHPRPHHALNS